MIQDEKGADDERARILALLRAERQRWVVAARTATPTQRAPYRLVAKVLGQMMREVENAKN